MIVSVAPNPLLEVHVRSLRIREQRCVPEEQTDNKTAGEEKRR
jgi:hypothetical protein